MRIVCDISKQQFSLTVTFACAERKNYTVTRVKSDQR